MLRPDVDGVGCNKGDTEDRPERSLRPAIRLGPLLCATNLLISRRRDKHRPFRSAGHVMRGPSDVHITSRHVLEEGMKPYAKEFQLHFRGKPSVLP